MDEKLKKVIELTKQLKEAASDLDELLHVWVNWNPAGICAEIHLYGGETTAEKNGLTEKASLSNGMGERYRFIDGVKVFVMVDREEQDDENIS